MGRLSCFIKVNRICFGCLQQVWCAVARRKLPQADNAAIKPCWPKVSMATSPNKRGKTPGSIQME